MKLIIFVCLTFVAANAGNVGRFDFAYEVPNSHSHTQTANGEVVKGSYSVVDSNGIYRTIRYSADATHGFVVEPESQEALLPSAHDESSHEEHNENSDDGQYHETHSDESGDDGSYHERKLEEADDGSYHEEHSTEGGEDGTYHEEPVTGDDGSYKEIMVKSEGEDDGQYHEEKHEEGDDGSYHEEHRETRESHEDDGQYHESVNPIRLVPVPLGQGHFLPYDGRVLAPHLPYNAFPYYYHPYGYNLPYGYGAHPYGILGTHPYNLLRY